jgi:hypothetical protein
MNGLIAGLASKFRQEHRFVMIILAVMALVSLAVLHLSCHAGMYSFCLLISCSFILLLFGFTVLVSSIPLLAPLFIDMGIDLPYRLKRPPRI